MATDQTKTLDFLLKTINSSISFDTISHDYFLARIYYCLQPTCPYANFFLAKVHYILENWAQAEKYAIEAIGLLENQEAKSGFSQQILRDSYFCRARSQLLLGKQKELEETMKTLEEKGVEFKKTFETLQNQVKKLSVDLEKYVKFQCFIQKLRVFI